MLVRLALLGPPGHRARLGGEADWRGLFGPLGAGVRRVVVPLGAGVRLVPRFCLLAERQQLLHGLRTGRTCSKENIRILPCCGTKRYEQ